jgi:glycosyltransferase involved in cell wall biosynthesis
MFFGTIYLVLLIFKKFDYIFVYQTSPIFSVIPAIIFSKIKKIPLIVWVQDLWPETLTGTYHVKYKFIYNIANFFCKKIYESADIIFSQSNSIKENLKKKFKKKKIFYLPNIIQNSIKPVINSRFRKEMKLDKSKNIMFAGNLGDAQNLEILIKLAVKFKKNKNLNFLLVGTGSKRNYLEEKINKLKLKNIILLGHQSVKKMSLYFSLADFMVITLKNNKIFWITVPNKLIAYMAAGKPIISLVKGETSNIVKKAKCGYYINEYSIKNISKVLKKAIKSKESEIKYFSLNSRKYYDRNYNQDLFYKKFINGIKLYENSKANLLRYT